MLEYIYFVKCPGCEDEHFDFFNEAKDFAMSMLSKKPIITQIEVDRNDFGECTDSCDLGTVWSWEEAMGTTEAEPAQSVFTKADLKHCDCAGECGGNCKCGHHHEDPEFAAIDNSLEVTPEQTRKPVPADMSISDLVEAMEANEDTIECAACEELFPKDECFYDEERGWLCGDCEDRVVKCTWCDELYDKSECRREVDLGWLCDHCQAGIMSRGEPLTFRENSYWDFLEEGIIPDEYFADCLDSSDFEIWGLKPAGEARYDAILLKRFKDVNLRGSDAEQAVYDEMHELGGVFTFSFDKKGNPTLLAWNGELLRKFGRCEVGFADERYEAALAAVFNRHPIEEAMDPHDLVELEYPSLTVTLYGPKRDVDDWDEEEYTDSHVFLVSKVEVATAIWENWITDEDAKDVEGGLDALEDDAAWEQFLETHFDTLFEKYNQQILDYFKAEATEDFRERAQEEYGLDRWSAEVDRAYDAWRDEKYFGESFSDAKPFLAEYDELTESTKFLSDCPECGVTESFDHETGICINCGFNI